MTMSPPPPAVPPLPQETLVGVTLGTLVGALVLCVLLLCLTTLRLLLSIAAAHDTSPWTLLGLWVERSPLVRVGGRGAWRAWYWLRARASLLPGMRPAATPHVVWARLCRRANKEPTEGPPDVLWRPFVSRRLWSSVREHEAAQLHAWLHATRDNTPFIEELHASFASSQCPHSPHDDACWGSAAHPEFGARTLRPRRASSEGMEPSRSTRSKALLSLEDLLRFCLHEQGAQGRVLWGEWKAALRVAR